MKLASKKAIGLMLDGHTLVRPYNLAWYEPGKGFLYQCNGSFRDINHVWESEKWELQNEFNTIKKESAKAKRLKMQLASKEAILLMLDGNVLLKDDKQAYYDSNMGFMVKYKSDNYPTLIAELWETEGWENV